MATKMLKLALPRAANDGTAMARANSATAAMRASLLMPFIGFSFGCLEPVTEVQADQVSVGVVRPVDVRAAALRAALLEVEGEFRGVDDPRPLAIADSESHADAVGVGEQRADRLHRLRVLVVQRAEANIPLRIDHVIRA